MDRLSCFSLYALNTIPRKFQDVPRLSYLVRFFFYLQSVVACTVICFNNRPFNSIKFIIYVLYERVSGLGYGLSA